MINTNQSVIGNKYISEVFKYGYNYSILPILVNVGQWLNNIINTYINDLVLPRDGMGTP